MSGVSVSSSRYEHEAEIHPLLIIFVAIVALLPWCLRFLIWLKATGDIVICYHFPCLDGIFSALIAREKLKHGRRRLRFVPMNYSNLPRIGTLDLKGNETVYILDFAAKADFVRTTADSCAEVVILDHHKSAQDEYGRVSLPLNVSQIFNLKKSGATLALEYFQPVLSKNVLQMIRMVEDGDLYQFKLQDTHAFRSGIRALRLNFDARTNPGIFDKLLTLDIDLVVENGWPIYAKFQVEMIRALPQAFVVDLSKAGSWGKCLAIEGSNITHLRSGLGHRLAERSLELGMRGLAIVAFHDIMVRDDSRIKLSFRSVGKEDTTKFTVRFGGGGHLNASGCTVGKRKFDRWKE